MSRIVPRLSLNKTPQLVDNNSLIMAKNIRLLSDGTIGPDTSLKEIERHTGNSSDSIIHHEERTIVVNKFEYTILNCISAIAFIKNNISFDYDNLDSVSFDFSNYKPTIREKNETIEYKSKYSKTDSSEDCVIYCKSFINNNLSWICERFKYDINNNLLVSTNGYNLLLAIKEEVYNDVSSIQDSDYYYIELPNDYINTIITIDGVDYKIINPVYNNKFTETVTKEAYDEHNIVYNPVKYIGKIVGLNNKIYFFREEYYIKYSSVSKNLILDAYPSEAFVEDSQRGFPNVTFDVDENGYVTRNGILFEDSRIAKILTQDLLNRVKIFEYDEVTEEFKLVNCAWRYNGGEITGCVTVNNRGEEILTICEYNVPNNKLVPIKHINLQRCKPTDDETFYTQAPNIPISNINLVGRYIKNIPFGVYQFFIRYKIRDEFYTPWFPCSKELFAGTRKQIDTLQGRIKYTDLHVDSNTSFILEIEHIFPNYCEKFEQYQLGFIISSDGGVFARSWKHFDMTYAKKTQIYFEYNKEDIEEINIDDLLKVNYDVFNAGNIASFKNKLYVSNYIETDFNEELSTYAKDVKIKLKLKDVSVGNTNYYFDGISLEESTTSGIFDKFGEKYVKDTFYNNHYCDIKITSKNESEDYIYDEDEYSEIEDTIFDKISKVYVNYNGVKYYLYGNNTQDANLPNDIYDNNVILDRIIDELKDKIVGIDANGNYKVKLNGIIINLSDIVVEYKTYKVDSYEQEDIVPPFDTPIVITLYNVSCSITTINAIIKLKPYILTTSTTYQYNEYNTLLPFTKYDFYIHYVKQNGIVTNGYFIGTKEITRYCRGYYDIPSVPIGADVTQLDSVDDLDDICFYDETNKTFAYNSDTGASFRLEEEVDGKCIIYPSFDNIKCPPGYVGCFISISKYGNNVAQGFNYEYNSETGIAKLDCIELDTLLYNIYDNIIIKNSKGVDITNKGVYHSSSTTDPINCLGCSGHIEFNNISQTPTKYWIILDSTNKPYIDTLRKLTPYIKLEGSPISYESYENVNSPGYYCEVSKLNREYCDEGYLDESNNPKGYYVSGNDIYTRISTGDDLDIELIDGRVDYHKSEINYISSNFNLNYVSLTQDLNPIIRRFDVNTENDAEDGVVVNSSKQFITVVDSLIASFILELKSTYKDYTRKTYTKYTKNNITTFNNTVRVSSIDGDELLRYIHIFEATDYYNVPTHRGIITNLFSIANSLYVHCEHSLFKFTDNKTINAETEEVVLQENDIFNSGITEVFDAQYGYAGLKNNKQCLITYNSYVFYDDTNKTIYAFSGQQQIESVSSSIRKLIYDINPTDVRFVGDENHDRFFVNLINDKGNVCLSFSFIAKAFVSIHDIEFDFGFHTRHNTYFIHENKYNNKLIGWSLYKIVESLKTTIINRTDHPDVDPDLDNVIIVDNYAAYQNCYKASLIHISDCDDSILNDVNSANACIDIIVNTEYETIKALDSIGWICSEIIKYGSNNNYVAEETLNVKYPGNKLRIYSDSTETDLFDLFDVNNKVKISNEQRNINSIGDIKPNILSWQYPQYNCGIWNMNYFRNTRKINDIFDYKNDLNKITGKEGHSQTTDLTPKITRENLTQENSLIYGKYFVLRFIFNNRNFKFENIIIRMSNYDKTK